MPPQSEALGSPVGVLGHGPGVRFGVADIFSLSNQLLRVFSLAVDVEVFEAWEFLIAVVVTVTVTVTVRGRFWRGIFGSWRGFYGV